MRPLLDYFRPPPIRSAAALREFISGEASYLAQRSTYEFSRNALAWYGQAAFGDPEFNDAFRICRWETFAIVLSNFVLLARARLAARVAVPAGLDDALVAQARIMLAAYPTPVHRRDWEDVVAELADRLAAARQEEPPSPAGLGAAAAARVYPTMPVQSGNKAEDRKVIANALSFGTIAFNDRLAVRLDDAAVVADLVAEPAAAAAPR
ncbi:MAG: hypothetical protein JNK67_26730 [Alphaproteobacteria bacterium]|nr:hypothetical protein [Alphaproteobacteria bacterium]